MIPIEQDAVLSTNLDCQGFRVLNIHAIDPVPPPLVSVDDSRLSDQRPVPNGSVTDASIAASAAIDQSKLSFNGLPPASWLGNASNQFARGDLVQLKSQKGVAGGYAGMDAAGKLPSSVVTTGGGGGKVNSVGLAMPREFNVTPSPIVTNGVFAVSWANAADASWFGAYGQPRIGDNTQPLLPSFLTKKLPLSLVPGLDGSKFTTGIFPDDYLPPMSGVGTGHAPGLVPDPGENGDPNDYLGRDGKWRPFVMNFSYQPTLPDVTIQWNPSGPLGQSITLRTISGAVLFYRINNSGGFIEAHVKDKASESIELTLAIDDFVEAYASKAGYNNSNITTYVVALPSIEVET